MKDIKKYEFIQFNGIVPRGDTKIAINRSGLIRLSAGFCRITNVKRFKYVVLFYDSKNKAIAIKFTDKKVAGILTKTDDRTAATISGKSFFKINNIDLKKNFGRYNWEEMSLGDIGRVYVIDLTNK